MITGGFPCQPHSLIGTRRGRNDKRNLWPECNRVLSEIRPEIALFENVPGMLNSNGGKFFNGVLSDISKSGYDAEWQTISASQIGAPHKRERVWIIAYPSCKRLMGVQNKKIDCKDFAKENKQKHKEWEQLQSITCGNYFMENWEAYEQIITGTYDGLPEELDAIKGAGNAIVPQCAELIFNLPCFDKWRIKNEYY